MKYFGTTPIPNDSLESLYCAYSPITTAFEDLRGTADGTLEGGLTLGTGKWTLDGSNDNVNFTTAFESILEGTTQFTIGFFIKPSADAFTNFGGLFTKYISGGDQSGHSISCFLDNTNKFRMSIFGGVNDNNAHASTNTISTGELIHLTASVDTTEALVGDQIKMWFNGVPETTITLGGSSVITAIRDTTANTRIGAWSHASTTISNLYEGDLFYAYIISKVSTDSEIAQFHKSAYPQVWHNI